MVEPNQSSSIKISVQLGNFKVEVDGPARKELTEKLSAALHAIRDNVELSNAIANSLGVAVVQPGTPSQRSEGPGAKTEGNSEDVVRISKDAGIALQKLNQLVELRKVASYAKSIPILRNRPEPKEAVYAIAYLMQAGPQWDNIPFSDLKTVLVEENGFLLPGDTLGEIVKHMERKKDIIRSPTQKRNKPIRLSLPGVEEAKKLLRAWSEALQ